MLPEEIDRRIRQAYDTGLLEGTLRTKEANQRSLLLARLSSAGVSILSLVIVVVVVIIF